MARVWIPLPDRDFDVTEVAVPWARWPGDTYLIAKRFIARLPPGHPNPGGGAGHPHPGVSAVAP